MLDILHRIGPQRVLGGHLQTGGSQIGLHLPGVILQLDDPLLLPLGHQKEDGGHQLPVVFHPDGRGIPGGGGPVHMGCGAAVRPLQYGSAARQGQKKTGGQPKDHEPGDSVFHSVDPLV